MDLEKGKTLTSIARNAIGEAFGHPHIPIEDQPWLHEPTACFVTLTLRGVLKGCIGSIETHRPLIEDLKNNAKAAAFNDPRFSPLEEQELKEIRIEVSILSPSQPIIFTSEDDALKQLKPHEDGVIFEYGKYRSTFLPQVWESLPKPQDFLNHLKEKAGLAAGFWADDVNLFRYQVSKWEE